MQLMYSDGILPRAYGLPKIQGCPFRIISSIDGPLYSLALFLHRIISRNISKPCSHNSFQLVKKLSNLYIDNNYVLIFLDAISLFINIFDLAIECISNH